MDSARTRALLAFGIATAALVLTAPTAIADKGQFNVTCRWIRTAPDDPIVHPGVPGASHKHVFFGNPSISDRSTPESLRRTPGRCHRPGDHSAYWIPGGETRNPFLDLPPPPPDLPGDFPRNPRFFLRPFFYGVVYYRTAARRPGSIQPFPPGLRMIAGNAEARGPQPDVVSWKCVDGAGPIIDRRAVRKLRRAVIRQRRRMRRHRPSRPAGARLRRLTTALRRARHGERDGTGCPQGGWLKVAVRFPDCWDGRNLDSPDHKSHMATARRRGRSRLRSCPRSHPVPVPRLTLTVRYETPAREVTLSSGPTYTVHADFMNGWDQEGLGRLVRRCLHTGRDCGND